MEVVSSSFLPGDQHLVDSIVSEVKSQGIFDQFRKECFADVDTKPAYQNLRQRVEGSVTAFLREQSWRPDMNKNQVREMLRRRITDSGYLERGVERIVDQVVNPKINSVFLKKVEEVVYNYLGIQKPNKNEPGSGKPIKSEELLPTDLEAVSPEPVELILDEPMKVEKKETVMLTEDEKMDEDESPPFEPLEEKSAYLQTEENSVDSHLSGISGLASHESNQSAENNNRPFQESTDENSSSRSDDKKDNLSGGNGNRQKNDRDRSHERHRSDKDRNRKYLSSKDYHHRDNKSRDYKDSARRSDDRDKRYYKSSSSYEIKRSSSASSSRDNSKYGRKDSNSRDRERTHSKDSKSRDRTTSSSSEKYRRDSSSKHSSSSSSRKSRDKRKDVKDDHYSSRDKRNERRSTDRDSNDGHSSKNSSSGGNNNIPESNGQSQKGGVSRNNNNNGQSGGDSGNSDQTESKTTSQDVDLIKEDDIKNLNTKLVSELEVLPSPLANTVISQDNWDAMEAKLRETIGTEFNNYLEEDDNKFEPKITEDLKNQIVDEESLENILGHSSNDEDDDGDGDDNHDNEEPVKIEEKVEDSSEDCKYFEHVEENEVEFLSFANDYIMKSTMKKRKTVTDNRNNTLKKRKIGLQGEDPAKEDSIEDFPLPLSPAESDASLDKKEEPTVVVMVPVVKPKAKPAAKPKVNHQRYSSDDLYKPRPAFMSSRRRNKPLEQ